MAVFFVIMYLHDADRAHSSSVAVCNVNTQPQLHDFDTSAHSNNAVPLASYMCLRKKKPQ